MISASKTRATRSRYSSPAQPQQGPENDSAKRSSSSKDDNSGSRTLMQRWLEPSVQNKTSGEQAGLQRYGVLGNMAPLGSMPKGKKQDKENGHSSTVRKIILRPSAKPSSDSAPAQDSSPAPNTPATTGDDAVVAAAASGAAPSSATSAAAACAASAPAPSAPNSSPITQRNSSTRRPLRKSLPTHNDNITINSNNSNEDDEEYDPVKSASLVRPMGRPALPKRGRPPSSVRRNSIVSSTKVSPVKRRHSSPPPPQHHALLHQQQPAPYESLGPRYVERAVAVAVDEAVAHNRYPTAWALRSLYDERVGDAKFITMLERVSAQTADASEVKSFSKMLAKKKREGRRHNHGRDYFVPPSGDGRVAPHQPKAAPYAKLIHRTTVATDPTATNTTPAGDRNDGEMRATKKIKITHRRKDSSNENPREKTTPPASKFKDTVRVKVKTSSSRKRARRESGSSDSSLSPVENLSSPELPEDSELVTDSGPGSPSLRGAPKVEARSRARAVEATAGPHQPPSQSETGPITTRRKSLGSTKQSRHSRTSESNSPTTLRFPKSSITTNSQSRHRQTRADFSGDEPSMPGRLATSVAPGDDGISPTDTSATATAAPTATAKKTGTTTTAATRVTTTPDHGVDFWSRRMEASKMTDSYAANESSVRDSDATRETTPLRSSRRTRQSLMPSASARATRSASKRTNDDGDTLASPCGRSVSAQGEGSSIAGSRAVTPTATSLRPSKKQKTGLRVKSSPVKKKGGTAAGVPRAVGDALPFSTNGGNPKDQMTDNDEYCSACGNAGDVVCCDGCPRSFHFECVDMDPSKDLPDEWYCNECFVKRYPSRVEVHKGVFGSALNNLEKSIHRAFSLPKKVQYRFEGVKVGPDGDYEEVNTNKGVSTRRRTHGYEEAFDFFKQREDGEAVLCHGCQKSASDTRAIIPCSTCPLHWHIDCLDPPLAVPPVLKTWKCPAHMDDLLLEAHPLGPAHRFRKVKGSAPVTSALGRGLRNNGHIEIDWGSEPEDSNDRSGWRDVTSFGRTYKVPVKGVRLDFIEKLRSQGAGFAPRKDESHRRGEPYLTPPVEDVAQPQAHNYQMGGAFADGCRNMDEMQASLVLASLNKTPTDNLQLQKLTSALLASAEPTMISLIALGDASNVSRGQLADNDKVSLRALLAQMDTMSSTIRSILGESSLASSGSLPVASRAAALGQPAEEREAKAESEPLVTEPTPPSTIIDHEGAMVCD